VTVGLYAGSFDPPHVGHLSLIESAARWCSTLYVVVADNPNKQGALFTMAERQELLAASTAHLDNVVAREHAGLLVELGRTLEVDVLIRSMGKEQDLELGMAVANEASAGLRTLFLPPAAASHGVASSTIRATFLDAGAGAVEQWVPPPVFSALQSRSARVP
jgi:pantetheine-phosphate adenylyltransferase